MSIIKPIRIVNDTSLYFSSLKGSEVKFKLVRGTLAHRDTSTVDDNRFYITVEDGKHKGKRGWINDDSNYYQYNDF